MSDYTCVIFGLPWSVDENGLNEFFSKCGAMEGCRIARNRDTGKSRGFGFVTFSDEAGFNACMAMNGTEFEGRALTIQKAKERNNNEGGHAPRVYNDKNKVIVNSLSWNTTSDSLREALSQYGPLEECRVLVNRDTGDSRGVAIARFTNEEDMKKAIEAMNETEFEGRQITIRAFTPNEPKHNKAYYRNGQSEEAPANNRKTFGEEEKPQNNRKTFDEEEKEEKEEQENKEAKKSDDDDDDNAMEEEEKEETPKEEKPPKPAVNLNDAEEGRTLFIQNIPMDATQKDIFRFFRPYGRIDYVKLCVDKLTQLFRGTAFVQFSDRADADKLLEKYQTLAADAKRDKKTDADADSLMEEADQLVFRGRKLLLARAVTRSDLKQ
mgnify:CR=1 FL=1